MALERTTSLSGGCVRLAICLSISHRLFPLGLTMVLDGFPRVLAASTVAREGNSVAGAE